MKLLIVLKHRFTFWNAPPWFAERLRREFPQLEVVHLADYTGLESELPDTDIALAWSIRPEQFKLARKLRWIHSPAAAVHQFMFPELIASNVILTNARSVHGPVVAEHAIALMFAMAKRLPDAFRFQQQHQWAQQQMAEKGTRELRDSTVCLVGLGSIGSEIAQRARALGMRVLAVREHPENGKGPADEVFGFSHIDQALTQADFVVLAAPLTPSTSRFFNADRLGVMKPDAYLINVGRGALVNEPDLVAALQSNTIAGAALDVFEHEPLSPDSPLWDMPNVLITPHTAAVASKLWERHYELFSENLRRFFSGQPLLGIVDKQRGY